MNTALSTRSVVVAAKDQVSCEIAGETAILSVQKGVYYGLDSVGARIWSLIQEPQNVGEISRVLLSEYEVEAKRCESDLLALLENLLAVGLIEIKEESQLSS